MAETYMTFGLNLFLPAINLQFSENLTNKFMNFIYSQNTSYSLVTQSRKNSSNFLWSKIFLISL